MSRTKLKHTDTNTKTFLNEKQSRQKKEDQALLPSGTQMQGIKMRIIFKPPIENHHVDVPRTAHGPLCVCIN